jgi:uncharacterized membrane protein
MIVFLAQTTTDRQFGTIQLIAGLIGLLISIFLAYKCASNQRWLLFVLGFFCGIFWIVGWAMGPKRPTYY